MNKEIILEEMYKILQDSREWNYEVKEHEYVNYVEGVLDMTEAMLKKDAADTLIKMTTRDIKE